MTSIDPSRNRVAILSALGVVGIAALYLGLPDFLTLLVWNCIAATLTIAVVSRVRKESRGFVADYLLPAVSGSVGCITLLILAYIAAEGGIGRITTEEVALGLWQTVLLAVSHGCLVAVIAEGVRRSRQRSSRDAEASAGGD